MLRDGIGIEQNPEQSDKYFREAYRGFLKMDNKNADDRLLYRLGAMTLKGISYTAYPEKASEYFRRSAEMNDKYALCEYGKMLTEGDVISQDTEKGIVMLKRSAELGHSAASYALGKIYLFGKPYTDKGGISVKAKKLCGLVRNTYSQISKHTLTAEHMRNTAQGQQLPTVDGLIVGCNEGVGGIP